MRTIIILGAVALAGCVDVAELDGQRMFAQNCASCHGLDAKGSGPMARNLTTAQQRCRTSRRWHPATTTLSPVIT